MVVAAGEGPTAAAEGDTPGPAQNTQRAALHAADLIPELVECWVWAARINICPHATLSEVCSAYTLSQLGFRCTFVVEGLVCIVQKGDFAPQQS